MACDCPIVSTDVGDVKEVIGNTDGCYISSFHPEEVVEKIRMAIKFGSTTRGRDRLIQLGLDSVTIADKIINVYQQVLEIE
jgi:glycosyltransferase involved in cell wall biosynthesis